MDRVGVRELKAQLSRHLGRVAEGDEIVVTDRGRPVARLVPYTADAAVERGIEEGWIEPPRRSRLEPALRQRGRRPVLDELDEDRG
ncbi:MAG: type II toxin-antitoxin system prevent-host-death family antitoxin [Acidimicrobiia bacterium]|nr:type II toxin-antitoxin system prevent-host-death family antitoxin [Acidimicrobiia bacterium]